MCGAGGHEPRSTTATTTATSSGTLDFPEHLYAQLTDAHCHIQDDRENIHRLTQSWSSSALNNTGHGNPDDHATVPLLTGKVCLMGVQPSKDLGQLNDNDKDRDDGSLSVSTASLSLNSSFLPSSSTPVVTVSWNDTDTKGDWDLVSKLAQDHPDRFVPCFGIHPWFTHKYKPLEGSSGSTIELRGVSTGGAGGACSNPVSPTNTASSPSLSFSSSYITPVSGPVVGREAFLAMSKQLQEQMAKENRGQDVMYNGEDGQGTTTQHDTTSSDTMTTAAAPVASEVIELTSHHQYHPKLAHYLKVLGLPNSAPETYLAELTQRLPEPRALEPALKELRRQLEAHPHAVLGEIGLDRTARVPEPSMAFGDMPEVLPSSSSSGLVTGDSGDKDKKDPQKKTTLALTSIQHQLDIVREQLKLAASLNRAVSFHCVQAYGHWHDFLIQEGRQLKQVEADQGYQYQLRQIHASGGTAPISPVSPMGVRLSKKSTARLKREARDAAWERHVESTLQESSDEEEEEQDEEDDDDEEDEKGEKGGKKTTKSTTLVEAEERGATSADALAQIVVPPTFEAVLPPRLCMHSYGGSIDMLRAFTKMDHPPEIFFSFSILINGRLQERKLKELILAVPEDRLLIESDHHSHAQVDQLLVEMVLKVAKIRDWTIEETVEKTARNWHRFVYG